MHGESLTIISSMRGRVFYSVFLPPKRQASRSIRSNSFVEISGCLGLLAKSLRRSVNTWAQPFVLALYVVPRCLLNSSPRSFFWLCIIIPLSTS